MTNTEPTRKPHELTRGEIERQLHITVRAGQQALLLARGWQQRALRAEAALAERSQLDQELAQLTKELEQEK